MGESRGIGSNKFNASSMMRTNHPAANATYELGALDVLESDF
jgi:hypothetical protein